MYNPEITQTILTGVGGIATVQTLTAFLLSLVKNSTDKLKKVLGYVFAGLSSTAFTFGYMFITKGITIGEVPIYAGAVWFISSKIYDIYHTPKVMKP